MRDAEELLVAVSRHLDEPCEGAPPPPALQLLLIARHIHEVSHDGEATVRVKVRGCLLNDPPQDSLAVGPTVAEAELTHGARDKGRVSRDRVEALPLDRLIEITKEELHISESVQLCVEAREAHCPRIHIHPDDRSRIATRDQRLHPRARAEV